MKERVTDKAPKEPGFLRRRRIERFLGSQLPDSVFLPDTLPEPEVTPQSQSAQLTLAAVEVSKNSKPLTGFTIYQGLEAIKRKIDTQYFQRYVERGRLVMNPDQQHALRYLNSQANVAMGFLRNPEVPEQTFAQAYVFGLRMIHAAGKINLDQSLPLTFKDMVTRKFYSDPGHTPASEVYQLASQGRAAQEALCLVASSPPAQAALGSSSLPFKAAEWKVQGEQHRFAILTQAGIGLAHMHCLDTLMDVAESVH